MQILADKSRIISVYRFSLVLIFIRITKNSAWNLALFQEIWNINLSLLKCISFSNSTREYLSLHFTFLLHHTTRFVSPFHLALKSLLLGTSSWTLSSNGFRLDSPPEASVLNSFQVVFHDFSFLSIHTRVPVMLPFLYGSQKWLPLQRKQRKTGYACPMTGKGEWFLAPSHVNINLSVMLSLLSFHAWITTLLLARYLACTLIPQFLMSKRGYSQFLPLPDRLDAFHSSEN